MQLTCQAWQTGYCWISVLLLRKWAAMNSLPTSNRKGNFARVQIDTSRLPLSNPRSLSARFRRWWRNSLLRVFLAESRNLTDRISWIRGIHAAEHRRGKDSILRWLSQESVAWS